MTIMHNVSIFPTMIMSCFVSKHFFMFQMWLLWHNNNFELNIHNWRSWTNLCLTSHKYHFFLKIYFQNHWSLQAISHSTQIIASNHTQFTLSGTQWIPTISSCVGSSKVIRYQTSFFFCLVQDYFNLHCFRPTLLCCRSNNKLYGTWYTWTIADHVCWTCWGRVYPFVVISYLILL